MGEDSMGFLASLSREFHHGALTVWILDELSAASPSTVYELLERLRNRAGPDYPVWPSPVYYALGRLRSWGLVEVIPETGSRGPIRKHYGLTAKGRAAYPVVCALAERSWRGAASAPAIASPGRSSHSSTARAELFENSETDRNSHEVTSTPLMPEIGSRRRRNSQGPITW
jgi:DNA-binding PadR family transcriptional regulator